MVRVVGCAPDPDLHEALQGRDLQLTKLCGKS